MALIEIDQTDVLDMVVNELGRDLSTAEDFVSAEFEASRARAQRYYNGESDLPVDANRSKYVSTKVRDIIRNVRPSLMRTMLSCQHPVEFVPQSVAQGMISEMQTKFISQLFFDLGGYKTIYAAFHSAMLHKLGVVKYWYEKTDNQVFVKYTGLTEQQLMLLTSHPLIEVISGETNQHVGPQGMISTYDVEIVGTTPKGEIRMEWISLDDFVVDRNATCKADARVMAHRRNVTKSFGIEMGFDEDLMDGLNSDSAEANKFSSVSFARRGYTVDSTRSTADESMEEFLLTEAYYKADLDGTGVAQLYRFWLGGTSYELLDYERVDEVPFALFSIDPEAGSLWGKSLYDLVHGDADAMTSLNRATIDNFHMTNNPRMAVHEHMVNMDDVLNNDLGSPIRVRAAGQIQPITVPFTGGQALPLLQMMDKAVENKTGVTAAASGLDPDAMQSTDKDAVKNTIQLGQGQVELMCRNLGETGLVDLFKGLLHLSMTHLDTNAILRTPDGQQPVPLDAFDPDMKTAVRVGTGTGNYDEQMAMLGEIGQEQMQIMGQLGVGNPVVTMQHMQNTREDKMALIGMHNPRRYFGKVTPDMEKKMAEQQQQQSQQKEQAQMQIAQQQAGALQQAETIKAQAKVHVETEKGKLNAMQMQQKGILDSASLQQKEDASFRELMVRDDLARDQMSQSLYVEMAKMREDFAKAMAQMQHVQGMN